MKKFFATLWWAVYSLGPPAAIGYVGTRDLHSLNTKEVLAVVLVCAAAVGVTLQVVTRAFDSYTTPDSPYSRDLVGYTVVRSEAGGPVPLQAVYASRTDAEFAITQDIFAYPARGYTRANYVISPATFTAVGFDIPAADS